MRVFKSGNRKAETGKVKVHGPTFPSAFSLLELLVVIGMMALLLALIVPAFSSVGRANQLTAATQTVLDQLNRARQEALSRNRSVQFQIISASRDGSSNAWRAIRYVILNESGAAGSNAITNRVAWLPQSIIISPSSTLSVIPVAGTTTNVSLPGNRTGTATYFTFRPDGTTDITDPAVHWTLVDEKIAGDPPPNFSTIQVDTRTGRPRLFRP